MTPERWQRIDSLLQEAVKRPRGARSAFLDEVCPDAASRREVESLISFHEQAEDFLEVPAFEEAAGLLADQESLVGLAVGAYQIERLLCIGGMGEVYLAEDTTLDRKVAIKFLPAYLEADELAKRRLIREAKAAAKLEHPNICATYEVAEEASRSFIVMQYVEGETLAARIQRKSMGLAESLDVVIQVADALVEAHSHGIIHRDIKPQNIMITPRDQVKVLDFGLAKVVRSTGLAQADFAPQSMISAPGIIVGTAPYMSPEQAKGASVDARSDLFSLGVVLYECITGRLPFTGSTAMEICSQVIHVDPPPPSQLNPRAPSELDLLIARALAKAPDGRYQSAVELLEDLRAARAAAQREAPVVTKPIPAAVRTSNVGVAATRANAFRRPRVFIPAILGALAIGLGGLLAISNPFRAKPYSPPPVAQHWYSQGAIAMREGLYYKASKAFQQAVSASDEFALAHAGLAEAMTELDHSDTANQEILRARSRTGDLSALPSLDALYLQAITDTVSREFERAIQSYQEIARRAPASEKARAYTDLGRSYEKNDQMDEAIAAYQKATELAPEDPAAFLRLGTLYGRKKLLTNAEAAFNKAQEIYEALTNAEGVTEVLYERGVLYNDLERLGEARAQLERALEKAVANDNKHQRIRTLLQLSKTYYVDGKTTPAERYATQAMELAQANGMENLWTQGLIDLGKTFRQRRDYDGAEGYFQKAFESAQKHMGRRNEAMARLSLGTVRITDRHDADAGLPYIEQALEFYERGGYRRQVSDALIQRARAKSLKGEYDDAIEVYEHVLQVAQQIDDQSLVAHAHHDLGNTLNQQERYKEALQHLDESIAYFTLNNRLLAGYSQADRGDALWRSGSYADAREALRRARSLAEPERPDDKKEPEQPDDKNKPLLAKISLISACLTLSERRFPEAAVEARQALKLNEGEVPEVDARYTLGLAQAFSGKPREGKSMCDRAVKIARNSGESQLLSNALLALAEVMLESGDAQGAMKTAVEAQEIFGRARRQESEWRACLVAGRANQRAGDLAAARKYLTQAERLLAELEARWGPEAYNLYLTRPDVRHSWSNLVQALLDVNK